MRNRIAIVIALVFLSGCNVFDAKTFLTTNPIKYFDLVPGVKDDWEVLIWDETARIMREEYGNAFFNKKESVCYGDLDDMSRPYTTAVHAFNAKEAEALYNKSNENVIYPLGNMEALFHEYIHARASKFSEECRAEMLAVVLTNLWLDSLDTIAMSRRESRWRYANGSTMR